MSRNAASWTSAISRLTVIRAAAIAPVLAGVSRSRRSSFFCRQLTSVIAAPKVAPEAIAQPSRPGASYWIGLSEVSSTCAVASVNAGGFPVASWLAACTRDENRARTTPEVTWSAIE